MEMLEIKMFKVGGEIGLSVNGNRMTTTLFRHDKDCMIEIATVFVSADALKAYLKGAGSEVIPKKTTHIEIGPNLKSVCEGILNESKTWRIAGQSKACMKYITKMISSFAHKTNA